MATIKLLGTKIEMQGSLAAADTITGISMATEAVVTVDHSASPYVVGDLIVIDAVVGMNQINQQVVRVKSVTGTTDFTCEGLDSTGYGAYVSGGTAQKVTSLLNFDNATAFNFPEPTPNRDDVTTIHDTSKQEEFGLDDAAQITIPLHAAPFAAHMVELRTASKAKQTRAFKVTLRNGNILLMNCLVAGGRGLDGSAGDSASASAALTLVNDEQYFTS